MKITIVSLLYFVWDNHIIFKVTMYGKFATFLIVTTKNLNNTLSTYYTHLKKK